MFDIIYAYIKKTIILGKLTKINISMVLYKKLNLCSSPLSGDYIAELMQKKDSFNEENEKKYNLYKHLYASDEIEKYISPVLLKQLSDINVKPAIFVNFSEYGPTHERSEEHTSELQSH